MTVGGMFLCDVGWRYKKGMGTTVLVFAGHYWKSLPW